jgi:glucokinase
MMSWRLIADVGGSNVRFARAREQHAFDAHHGYVVASYSSFYDALAAFLKHMGGPEGCSSAAIGVAGPIDGDRVAVTNAPWSIVAGEVSAMLGEVPVQLVNDLQAVAFALPHLRDDEVTTIGPVSRKRAARQGMLALNVGTGFGAATAIPVGDDGWITNPGEPGHITLGAVNADELQIVQGTACVEDILSGRGMGLLYRRVAEQMGVAADPSLSAEQIIASASDDKIAAKALWHFSEFLGRVAGDLVLAAAAWGGVYLCGSVVNGWAEAGCAAQFRAPLQRKGIMSARMEHVYAGLIARKDVALIGLTYLPIEDAVLPPAA